MRLVPPKTKIQEHDLYREALLEAQKEYNVALSYFDEATEPEIIDEAIFRMEAARKKYSYFLRKYRGSVPSGAS
ncbi:MAG: DUF2508 family protein [Bacillota bacterium]|jgi:hypothetical protein